MIRESFAQSVGCDPAIIRVQNQSDTATAFNGRQCNDSTNVCEFFKFSIETSRPLGFTSANVQFLSVGYQWAARVSIPAP